MSEQSKAIELADYLRDKYCSTSNVKYSHAEKELRRLDAENAALRAQLGYVDNGGDCIVYGVRTAPQQAPVDERADDDELIEALKMNLQMAEEDGDKESAAFLINVLGRIRKADRAALKPAVPEGFLELVKDACQKAFMDGVDYGMLNHHDGKHYAALERIEAMLAAAKDSE